LRPEGLRPEGRPKPLFVVVEGVDRCGKSTLAEILAERMRVCGRTTYVFGIPDYSTSLGQLISQQLAGGEMLVGAGGERSRDDLLSLECLMICARYVTSHQIWQALTAGYSVVCVRWWQSALLYGTDDGLDPSLIEAACSALPEPDLNLLVQVEVKEIVHRLDPGNLYESDRPKQCRLAESYRELWSRWSGSVEGLKWVVVDGSGTIPEVADRAWKAVGRVRSDLK
jgi:dTMP kinase